MGDRNISGSPGRRDDSAGESTEIATSSFMQEARAALPGLLPANVSWAAECRLSTSSPYEAETLAVRNACRTRKTEFYLGRQCARVALSRLGVAACPILIGSNGEPIWPENIVGSISHTRGIAIAVAASSNDFFSLGIDIEAAEGLQKSLENLVLLETECDRLPVVGDRSLLAKLHFSAKEAVYKCMWLKYRRIFDFKDIELVFSEDNESFTVVPHDLDLLSSRNVLGRSHLGRLLITFATLAEKSQLASA